MNFLKQDKLTREEWNNLEKPINNEKEKVILNMIDKGYNDSNIVVKQHNCLQYYLKISNKYDSLVYDVLLKEQFDKINKNNMFNVQSQSNKKNKNNNLSKGDKIKLESSLQKFKIMKKENKSIIIIEFLMIELLKTLSKILIKEKDPENHKSYSISLYNLYKYNDFFNDELNKIFKQNVELVLQKFIQNLSYKRVLKSISKYVEHNEVNNFKHLELYQHQKDIYNIFKRHNEPKFIWYCAPTSSGKTLTPIGLTNEYKVLFMCASKHIGLGLAKSAYYCNKKIGFAFGCNNMEDVRLNFNAINNFTVMKNGYKKPDHSDGTKVEMMICDLMSFEIAMIYMKAFHPLDKIVLFWDEPTIGLDNEDHYLHEVIQKNWKINVIPNVVFSCATLPKQNEITNIVETFHAKFENMYFEYMDVCDQFSNVMIYDEYSNVIMPHNYFKDIEKMKDFLKYQGSKYYKFYNCNNCAKFILFYHDNFNKKYLNETFHDLKHIHMNYIKECYINILLSIDNQETWTKIYELYHTKYPLYNETNKDDTIDIGPELTTKSASSLTNGPTLYISNQLENISKFLLMKNNINKEILKSILEKIEYNNKIDEILVQKQKDYEDKTEKYKENDNVMSSMRLPNDILELHREIETLQGNIKSLSLDRKYIPNTKTHYELWNKNRVLEYSESDVYCSCINDGTINSISQLATLHHVYKILLLMGIGVFTYNKLESEPNQHFSEETHNLENNDYVEIMKYLAENKELYLILAHSDYIYGTNYQFSHCYLGKDMKDLSQEKIIQCIGRIGRQDKNKHFSFRFRCEEQINTFYSIPSLNIEAQNMNKLFV